MLPRWHKCCAGASTGVFSIQLRHVEQNTNVDPIRFNEAIDSTALAMAWWADTGTKRGSLDSPATREETEISKLSILPGSIIELSSRLSAGKFICLTNIESPYEICLESTSSTISKQARQCLLVPKLMERSSSVEFQRCALQDRMGAVYRVATEVRPVVS